MAHAPMAQVSTDFMLPLYTLPLRSCRLFYIKELIKNLSALGGQTTDYKGTAKSLTVYKGKTQLTSGCMTG